tara:strand:- start:77 stop:442 length:366 start_codon:yes stop_codon:yes gene_type:complete
MDYYSLAMAEYGTILDDITLALNKWLEKIVIVEENQRRVMSLQEKVQQTLLQIQQDGLISTYDFGIINYIGQVWIDLTNLLSSYYIHEDKDVKRHIINNLFKLYDIQQISVELFTETIVNL